MDRPPFRALDSAYNWAGHVHLWHLFHCTVNPTVHPKHLPSLRREHLLRKQPCEKSVRRRGNLFLAPNVRGHRHRWRRQPSRGLHGGLRSAYGSVIQMGEASTRAQPIY
jgi:hypothetical protein